MPSPHAARAASAAAIFLLIATEICAISVPTGKQSPITPAKVTPRPTYHPPSANPAPVHEYTYDNPEPAPLNPNWVPIPVKYLNVLRPNSILYIPLRIPNPAAQQPNYYNVALKEQPQPTQETTEATTYQKQSEQVYYQTQQPNTQPAYQNPQPAIAVYESQQPNAQKESNTNDQAQQPNATANDQVYQNQPDNSAVNEKPAEATDYTKETAAPVYQKEADQVPEFGAKIAPKQKWKPDYYLPKSQYKQATKSGYPKKVVAAPSQKYYYYYPIAANPIREY